MIIDSGVWERPDVRAALAVRNIGQVYRALTSTGVSQRQIATLTGQAQSEVSEIIKGRTVKDYRVLDRIANGLGIPREFMGLSYGQCGTYPEGVTVADPQGAEDMLRRHLLALGTIAAFGATIKGLGELTPDVSVPGVPGGIPARIGAADLEMIRQHTEYVRTLARTHGGQALPSVGLADWADGWLGADASETTRRTLMTEVSDLHVIAAWCCHDVGAVARSHYHFARAVELATETGDSYQAAYAMRHAAMMLIDRGQPNDALKLAQLAEVRLDAVPRDDPRRGPLESWLHVESAFALSRLGDTESTRGQARTELGRARDGWTPPNPHAGADMDLITALTQLHLGELDSAHAAAATSVRAWRQGTDRREGVVADITLARVNVRAGEPTGLRMSAEAIESVRPLRSGLAREWLIPLADDLGTQPGSDAQDLARTAREVAATGG
jgi:transcriptional regulator with XRE-family HTH domain